MAGEGLPTSRHQIVQFLSHEAYELRPRLDMSTVQQKICPKPRIDLNQDVLVLSDGICE